jgi:hypothetical protein
MHDTATALKETSIIGRKNCFEFLFTGSKWLVTRSDPGLPDGLFSNQKSRFGLIWECLAIKDGGKFYGHSVYLTVISYILWPIVHFVVILLYFSRFGTLYQENIWQPWSDPWRGCKI